jgi:hypothetical protein
VIAEITTFGLKVNAFSPGCFYELVHHVAIEWPKWSGVDLKDVNVIFFAAQPGSKMSKLKGDKSTADKGNPGREILKIEEIIAC